MSDHEHEPEKREAHFQVEVPPQEIGGRYANFLGVWHTPHEFTLDFAVTQPPQGDPEDADGPVVVPLHVTARVKIPPSLVFDILRALNENMTRYEDTFGPIHRPHGWEGETP